MLIQRTSPVTGLNNIRDLDIDQEQMNNWLGGALIQKVMPNLSADDREFLITGMTPEDWEDTFGE
jgi:hypothetical protein